MTLAEVIAKLEAGGSQHNIDGMARYGIRPALVYGLNAPSLQAIAKSIKRDHPLALELWATGYHEARIIAAFIADPAQLTSTQMDAWARDCDSWALVDTITRHAFLKSPLVWEKIPKWAARKQEYIRRCAFSQIAWLAVHAKKAPDAEFLSLLPLINEAAADERPMVHKAVNWALRQIGKRNSKLRLAAVNEAEAIGQKKSRSARWVSSDALRELRSETVKERLARKELTASGRR